MKIEFEKFDKKKLCKCLFCLIQPAPSKIVAKHSFENIKQTKVQILLIASDTTLVFQSLYTENKSV